MILLNQDHYFLHFASQQHLLKEQLLRIFTYIFKLFWLHQSFPVEC